MHTICYLYITHRAGRVESESFCNGFESSPSRVTNISESSRVESSCLCYLPGLGIFLLRILAASLPSYGICFLVFMFQYRVLNENETY
jgi:hypothetical protein